MVCIDAEDATRSTWCRYINNQPRGSNLRARINTRRQLVWFEARRDIQPGEELTFSYNDESDVSASTRWALLALCWLVLVTSVVLGRVDIWNVVLGIATRK